ncbi:MAG: hypothetical protein AB7O32_07665 [Vicinamibacterales bacterium]
MLRRLQGLTRVLSVVATAALAVTGSLPSRAQDGTIVPGRVVGELRFANPSPDVLAQCVASPAIAPSANPTPVALNNLGGMVVGRGAYVPVNAASGPDFALGSYDLNPNTSGVSTSFLISTDSATFSDGASYRFGSPYPAGIGVRMCSDVLPVAIDPAGRRCDQTECATLLNVKFRFTGAATDLAALDTSLLAPPATCTVQSGIREPSIGGQLVTQSSSGARVFSIPELIAGYKSISLLVRGNTEATVSVACSVRVVSGASGFVVVPATGLTPLSAARVVTPPCAPSGSPTPAQDVVIDVPVERSAGEVRGKLDLVGFAEENAKVLLGDLWTPFVATASVDAANPSGALLWRLTGVPSGSTPATAMTLAEQRDKFVVFPARDGLNERVPVIAGLVADLGATFIARPREVRGKVTLFDFGRTDLAGITLRPFAASESFYSRTTSYAEAVGNAALPQDGGASGIGGASRARLRGAYDTSTGIAGLDFHLLLPGIGLAGASADGTGARNVSWDYSGLSLLINPTGVYELLTLRPGMLLRVDTGSPAPGAPVQAGDQSYCFGRETLTLSVDPAQGALYSPSSNLTSTTNFEPVAPGATPVASANASVSRGLAFAQRAATISLPATLVAGLGYQATTYLRYAPAGATSETQSTFVYVPAIAIPSHGVVPCAGDGGTCVSIDGQTGASSVLAISILDATGVSSPSYCLASGPASLLVKVTSTSPQKVSWVLDPPAGTLDCAHPGEQVLCDGNCNVNPQFTVGIAALGAGAHVLRACASDTRTCAEHRDYSFEVRAGDLAVQCPAPVTVTLGAGETSIARTDPRIASQLAATVSGTCGIPPAVSDNAPASFPLGTTIVTYSAPQAAGCSTPVNVNPFAERQLGVKTLRNAAAALDIYRVTSPVATLLQTVNVGAPFQYAFSPDGSRVAIVRNDGRAFVVDLGASPANSDVAAASSVATLLKPPHAVAWHRGGNAFAVVGVKPTTTAVTPTFAVVRASPGAPMSVIQTNPVPVPSFLDPSRVGPIAIAYAVDGNRFVLAASGPRPNLGEFANFAATASTQSSGRITTSTWRMAIEGPMTPAAREEVLDLSVTSTQSTIVTTRQAWRLNTAATAWIVLRPQPTYDAALLPSGKAVAYVEDGASGQWLSVAVFGTSSVNRTASFAPAGKGEVAIAHDGRRAAAVAQPGVLVFGADLGQISVIPDPNARSMRFRPGS